MTLREFIEKATKMTPEEVLDDAELRSLEPDLDEKIEQVYERPDGWYTARAVIAGNTLYVDRLDGHAVHSVEELGELLHGGLWGSGWVASAVG